MGVVALERRAQPKAIKIARQKHICGKCGAVIKPGDSFAMCIDRGTFTSFPTCLKCYTEYKPEEYQ
jgi:RNase P subunit RPR2